MKKLHLAALTALALTALPTMAQATVTQTINGYKDNSGLASFWTDTLTFVLPAGFTNATLNISYFAADDRAIAELNGNTIDATGIYGPGTGSFVFTSGGSNDPYAFTLGNGDRNINVTSGFATGVNTIQITVNDTWYGIYGSLSNGPNGPAGPTAYDFRSVLTYDQGAVPEPASWALMIGGLGLAGAALRRRPTVAQAA